MSEACKTFEVLYQKFPVLEIRGDLSQHLTFQAMARCPGERVDIFSPEADRPLISMALDVTVETRHITVR